MRSTGRLSGMSFRSTKLLRSAQGQACVLCRREGTTVSAHCNLTVHGKGIGIKCPDCLVAWLCHECHSLLDGQTGNWTKEEKRTMWYRAFAFTVVQWFEQGIVEVT